MESDVFLSGPGWEAATQRPSGSPSAGGPARGRGSGLGWPPAAPPCPFPDRLGPCGAGEVKAGRLVGRVLCAGARVGVGSTGHTGDLRASDLGGGDSSLWEDAPGEPLGSMEAPCPCRVLAVLLSGSLQGQLVHPWRENRRVLTAAKLAAQLKATLHSLPCAWGWGAQMTHGPWLVISSDTCP